MIIIHKNSLNTFNVRDGVQTPTIFYLFVILSKKLELVKYIQIQNISNYDEYLQFQIDEDINEDILNGVVYLPGNSSDFNYKIYPIYDGEVLTIEDLDLAYENLNESELVSKGLMRVMGEEQDTQINDIYL